MNRWLTLTFAFALTFTTVIANLPAAPVAAEDNAAMSLTTQDLSLDQAQLVLSAALAAAEEQGTLMDIAVVDNGGNLKAFARMDGAWRGSIDIAQKKAFTARLRFADGSLGGVVAAGGTALRHRSLQWRTDHLPRRAAAES
jgi:hypothetical protein